MSRYPLVPLGEVVTLSRDEVSVQADATYHITGIYSFGRGLFARPPITGAETKYKTLYRIHKDQLVLSRLNGWEGALAVVPPEFDSFCVSQEYPTFDVDTGNADPEYLKLLCRWDHLWDLLVPKGSMVRRKRSHPDRLLAIEVPLPPLEEQQRLTRRIDFIVTRAHRALQFAAGETSTKLIASILSQFDRSSPKVPLGEVLSLARDQVPVKLEETYRIAGIYSFGRGLFARPPITGAETKYKTLYRIHKDQLVLSRLKAWEGAVAIVTTDFDGMYVSQEYPTFEISSKRAEPSYLSWLCRWDHLWNTLRGQSKGVGARRDRVHPDRLLATQIPLPPLEEQRKLAGIARTMNKLDEVTHSFNATFKALEPSIIGAAIEGRL